MLDDTLDILPWARQTLRIEAVEATKVRLSRSSQIVKYEMQR